MRIEDINMYSNFSINGKWGFEPDNIKYSGILTYNDDGIKLHINDCNAQSGLHKALYGEGNIIIDNTEIPASYISLFDCYLIDSNASFDLYRGKSTSNSIALIKNMIIGKNGFATKNIKFNKIDLKITNFSNWLSNPYNYLSNKDETNLKEIDSVIINNKDKISIFESISKRQLNTLLVSGTTYENFYFISVNREKSTMQFEDINATINYISSFFSLVSNSYQHVIQTRFFTDNNTLFYFEAKKSHKVKNNEFTRERFFVPRNLEFTKDFIKSMSVWLNEIKELYSIYIKGINYYGIGSIDQKLMMTFSAIDKIAKTYYNRELNKSGRKNSMGYKMYFILKNLDDYINDKLLSIFCKDGVNCNRPDIAPKEKSNYNKNELRSKFCERFREIRNDIDHGNDKLNISNKEKYKYLIATCFAVRMWLLKQVQVPDTFIKEDIKINDISKNELIW